MLEKLIDFIERADDVSSPVKALRASDEWGEPRRAVLPACSGTRQGLLDRWWDLLCLYVGARQESESSLVTLAPKFMTKPAASISPLLRSICRKQFQGQRLVSRAEVRDYAWGSPQRTPQGGSQHLLEPRILDGMCYCRLKRGVTACERWNLRANSWSRQRGRG